MSEEARLARLGLLHLKDKPEELARELDRRRQEFDERADAWEQERKRRRGEKPGDARVLKAGNLCD